MGNIAHLGRNSMASRNFRKSLKRNTLAVALGMCFATPVVYAQSAVGSMNGTADAGAKVTIVNEATGFNREISADSRGRFSITQLAPGTYKVTSGGVTREVPVRVGTGSAVVLTAATLDAVHVRAIRGISPIDVSSVESTTVLTAEQFNRIPVLRDTTSIALLAPGTVRGDSAFGNLASFGGSSVAENQYYVNGFNVSNTFRNLNFGTIPFEGVAEQQTKTGGYGAEFGRSLGGVTSVITKRGTNEYHAGGNIYWTPKSLTDDVKNTYFANPLTPDEFQTLRSDNSQDGGRNTNVNVWGSGAVIQDRLFLFGLLSYTKNLDDSYGSLLATSNTHTSTSSPTWLLKMDWNINDSNLLEFTAFSDKSTDYSDTYTNPQGSFVRSSYVGQSINSSGGRNYISRWTSYLTDTFTLSALYGHSKFARGSSLIRPDGTRVFYDGDINNPVQAGCPVVVDARPGARQAITGPYSSSCNITGGTLDRFDSGDKRDQLRVDLEWQLGDHFLRGGFDGDKYSSVAGVGLEGGSQWRYATNNGPDRTPNTADDFDFVRQQVFNQGATVKVKQHAFYVEDTWSVTDNFVAYVGGRWDTFENINGNGDTYVKIKDQFGPRLGASWDVNGDASLKIFGNYGRYALPLTPSVAVRGASASIFSRQNFTFDGVDPETGAPLNIAPLGPIRFLNAETGEPHIASTVASQNLKPMFQDEFILGFQAEITDNLNVGMRGVYRDLKAAIDDNCDYTAVLSSPDSPFTFDPDQGWWFDADGNSPSLPGAGFPYCRMFNPGADAVFLTDFYGDGNLTTVHVPGELLAPKARRTYKAVELFFDGHWDNLFLQGSYTWSKSQGNTEGGVKSDIGQADTSVTQDFDYLALAVDSDGYLPNDRRHSFKLFGSYDLNEQWSIGANLLVQSGRPLNCLGVLDLDPTDGFSPHPYGSSFFRCGTTQAGGSDDATVERFPRGSGGRLPWTGSLDLNLTYRPSWVDGVTMKLDVFNITNSQKVTAVNEQAEDPSTGDPVSTYKLPDSFQSPRSFRFMLQYEF
jgi:hypothetical protein